MIIQYPKAIIEIIILSTETTVILSHKCGDIMNSSVKEGFVAYES